MAGWDRYDDRRRDERNKLYELVNLVMSLEVLQTLPDEDCSVFMVELESCKTWHNGTLQEYTSRINDIKQQVNEIQVKFREISTSSHNEILIHFFIFKEQKKSSR